MSSATQRNACSFTQLAPTASIADSCVDRHKAGRVMVQLIVNSESESIL